MPSLRFFAAPTIALGLLALPSLAHANGRFPEAGQIVVDPSDPDHVVVRATYGLVTTRDGGARWDWICEGAVGFGGVEDPSMGVMQNGTLLAGIFHGLSVSSDGGCDWAFIGGELIERFAVDVSVEKSAPQSAVVLASNGITESTFLTQIYETHDNGASFTQAGVDLPDTVVGVTLDAAPSDPQTLYVSGRRDAPSYIGVIARSTDRGASWTLVDVPGADATTAPFIAAIDPSDPLTLYVRLDGKDKDTLLVSHDGGDSYDTVFETEGMLLGFALSPDGSDLLFGGPGAGLFRADSTTLTPTHVSDINVKCLAWTVDALYACGDEFKDAFTVGRSTNGGASFEPLMHLGGMCGPLECADTSTVTVSCTGAWPTLEAQVGSIECDASGSGGGGDGAAAPSSGDDGCGCETPGKPANSLPALLLLGGLGLNQWRRAKSRRKPISNAVEASPPRRQ